MESLPQIATALQHVLTTVAESAAAEVGFVRRRRMLTGASFVQALVLGWLACPEATLHQLTQGLAVRGTPLSPQGLAQRYTPAAAALLERVLAATVATVVAGAGAPLALLTRFAGVSVLDCTTVRLPDALGPLWPGCGGRVPQGTAAALKLQVRLDLIHGRMEGPYLLAGRTQDKAGPLHTAPLPPGALLLADLGYWSLARFRELGQTGAYWLSRLDPHTSVRDDSGQRLDLPRWLAQQRSPTVEAAVALGATARLPVRLLAARVPQAVADARRRKLRAAATREGKLPPQATVALAGWTVSVTNVPAARLTLVEAHALGRARWQIELLFKLWKRDGQLATWRSSQPWRVLTEISAKLTGLVLQHWVLLVGCWAIPDRSLVRAAQTIRAHALSLLRALDRVAALTQTLQAICRCLAAGCRLATRHRHPSTFQRLRDPTLSSLT